MKNNKGFMLAEAVITSTIVLTTLIGLYATFSRLYNLYNISIKANESLDINIDLANDGYNKKYNSYEIIINSLKYSKCIINNKELHGDIKGKSVIFRFTV